MKRIASGFWILGSFLLLMSSFSSPIMLTASVFFLIGSVLSLAEK